MTTKFSRRDFLKLSGLSVLGLGFRDFPPGGDPLDKRSKLYGLGRAVYSLRYYRQPSLQSDELGFYVTDAVFGILEKRLGNPEPVDNPWWLRTEDGWIQSAYVQPVKNILNEAVLDFPAQGMLVEVTVPFTQAYEIDKDRWKRTLRFYYGSTHWVHHAFKGLDGKIWYKILDDRRSMYHYALGEHFRPIQAEEIGPLSVGVPDKRVEVDLIKQSVIAYEGNRAVRVARTATGYFEGDTPKGEFIVERKQPSRHMANDFGSNTFDLPGVPWVCYISWTGVSFHGTYWHNNYGTPQSHGCINLSPSDALWFYRWTEPHVPFGEDYVETTQGTPVIVY
jgi:hypothetical protein